MKYILYLLITVAVIFGAKSLYFDKGKEVMFTAQSLTSLMDKKYEFVSPYVDKSGDFVFKVPKRFSIVRKENEEREMYILKSEDETEGIQIIITDYPENVDVTPELISRLNPELKIRDAQVVEVGDSRKGLAFITDNEDWDGASRQVWFIWNNRFYQITTYDYLEDLLKGFFATWELKKR